MFYRPTGNSNMNGYTDIIGSITREINLSRIGWLLLMILYPGTGIGAAFVSFNMQKDVFAQMLQEGSLSFWIVFFLEAAKVGTIIVYGLLMKNRKTGITTRAFISFFRFGLILVSFSCSLALLAYGLDRPNLEKVRVEDQHRIEAQYRQKQDDLKASHMAAVETAREVALQEQDQAIAELRAYYAPIIAEYRKDMRSEMNNVVNGTFKGPRYQEFERLLKTVEAEYHRKLSELRARRNDGHEALEERIAGMNEIYEEAREGLDREKERDMRATLTNTYVEDERAENRMIAALLRTINDGLLWYIDAEVPLVTFTCVFAIIVALLLEMTIYLCLHSAVLSFSPNLGRMFEFYDHEDQVKKNS